LIRLQIQLAAGEPMPLEQEEVRVTGHAIEIRINAEHPVTFVPSPGTITGLHLPGGLGIRVDSGVYEQAMVQPYYDSLVAKLIARGRDRETAIRRMRRALGECVIEGIHTTLPLHRRLIDADFFQANQFHTRFLESWLSETEEDST
jgi:acetyl-CoA carboxylase biotin carboxylase subunit